MKAKSPIEAAQERIQAELKGKALVRVNYASLERKTPFYAEAMFYLKSGWYRDYPFTCVDCGKLEIWTDKQQKWWYEVAKGGILTVATRCPQCRRIHRECKAAQSLRSIAGFEKKWRNAQPAACIQPRDDATPSKQTPSTRGG